MKIGLLGCKGTTLDLLNNLHSSGNVQISTVITLSESNAENNKVAFYRGKDIQTYCDQNSIECHVSKTYHLNDEEDLQLFKSLNIDLLLVIGWERLLPDAILNSTNKFACGMHGSAYGLPKGRGRSPLNWSILTGHRKFVTYLFRYDAGMDSGDIIGFKAFDINEFDTISSLHAKNRIVMQQLVEMYTPQIENDAVQYYRQPPSEPSFYPKRTHEDGRIDWNQNTDEVHALVKAVAFPYPSAFSAFGDKTITIDQASPFDTALFDSNVKAGTILDVSTAMKQFVVKTGNGSLLVTEFSGVDINDLKAGQVLESGDAKATMDNIAQRYGADVADHQKEI